MAHCPTAGVARRFVGAVVLTLLAHQGSAAIPSFPAHLVGDASAVSALLERVLPGSSAHFELAITPAPPGSAGPAKNGFTLSDTADGRVRVTGTTASELTGGLGVYLREFCGMTVGWVRGGGSYVFTPNPWPKVGAPVARNRSVPYSHVTQVCTHSYTLVWHNWTQWERFIDWMALAGHNSIVAPTGQEEVQYKVMTEHFGVADMDVRNWTNGPAWLTWSRGQNSHGNGIGGPLPRSFMKSQWALQKQILARYRELGIAGHLPSFGGYAPWALAVAQNATNRIARGVGAATDTAWIDGRDPLYTAVADRWMEQIVADFGSDHVWQMDAFFANGSGWGVAPPTESAARPACVWSDPIPNTYLEGYVHGQPVSFPTLSAAQAACLLPANIEACGGVVSRSTGAFEIRGGLKPLPVPPADGEASYILNNRDACLPPPDTSVWRNRSAAAYGAVVKVDGPDARWIYQGYALGIASGGIGPANDPHALDRLHSFTSPIPEGQFILLDMSAHGSGEFRDWKGQWQVPFIWTALHDYGGDMGIKGNLSMINPIPFAAPPLAPVPPGYDKRTQAVGVGYTPEGLDQNPAYYELLQEAAFKTGPEPNLTDWLVRRAHRRYGLAGATPNRNVTDAWVALAKSGYAIDKGVSDGSGVGVMGVLPKLGLDTTSWNKVNGNITTPAPALCLEWASWHALNDAARAVNAAAGPGYPEPYLYDLVNTGREVLSQLATRFLIDFSRSFSTPPLNAQTINMTASNYIGLLFDLEVLLGTNKAFMLGPWLAEARALGANDLDCINTQITGDIGNCSNFMEWNAKAQLTTWYPVIGSADSPIVQQNGRDHDYARKQWSGLINEVYVPRARIYEQQALANAASGQPFDEGAAAASYARMVYKWQTTFGQPYPTEPFGNPVAISTFLMWKYNHYFATC
eukprot:m.440986 g.440986  ORF g.440986 m.440986 type:complete len:917 (-) comp18600_c0_seq1:173-2923(-)